MQDWRHGLSNWMFVSDGFVLGFLPLFLTDDFESAEFCEMHEWNGTVLMCVFNLVQWI